MRHRIFVATAVLLGIFLVVPAGLRVLAQEPDQKQGGEEEFLIVKYGSILVKSDQPEAKVLLNGIAIGHVNTVIDSVITGEHPISCVAGDKTVSGTFMIKKNEVLKLEARFKEGKLVGAADQDTKKKKEAETKLEKKKSEEAKRSEKSPADERRDIHLNVFRLDFKNREAQEVAISPRYSTKVISGFAESEGQTGKYYKTKSGLLLCETGPCVQEWTSRFFYTDENGKRDAFMVTWKQMVYSGMTPSGTTSREITWCLNGSCKKVEHNDTTKGAASLAFGNYALSWTKESALFRRTDIMKEITDAGGKVPE